MNVEVDIMARLAAIFREELEHDDLDITLETGQADLENWDSLAHVRIVVAIERAFDIQLELSEIEGIKSIRGFYDAIKRRSA